MSLLILHLFTYFHKCEYNNSIPWVNNEEGDECKLSLSDFIYISQQVETPSVRINWFTKEMINWKKKGGKSSKKIWKSPCEQQDQGVFLCDKYELSRISGDIVECNYNCPCFSKNTRSARISDGGSDGSGISCIPCNNRPISNGLSHHFEIFRTAGGKRGFGLRTANNTTIQKDEIVFAYIGLVKRSSTHDDENTDYYVSLGKSQSGEIVVDGLEFRNLASFVNHRYVLDTYVLVSKLTFSFL